MLRILTNSNKIYFKTGKLSGEKFLLPLVRSVEKICKMTTFQILDCVGSDQNFYVKNNNSPSDHHPNFTVEIEKGFTDDIS